MSVTIALLGEVAVRIDGRPVDLGPPRQRCVLAALAVDVNRLLPADRLMGRVWGLDAPPRGRATLHSYISRLRGAFAGALTIVRRSGGYLLELDRADEAVDLLRFRALCDRARDAGEDARRVPMLVEALALWRGDPLAGLCGSWVDRERDRWRQERWAAEHDLVDARLRIGHGEGSVASLAARTTRHPLDERVAGQYMLALHRAGRRADALEHYRRFRRHLVAELGTDPGTELRNLHQRILTADPALAPAPAVAEPVVIPRQLPAAPVSFVGRRDELDRLDATVSTGCPVAAISGPGGIGKTWLALTWAHQHLDRFPDGQLFADLQGFSPTGQPAAPTDVLARFLDGLGVTRDRQPGDRDCRADLYRSMVADKRMLIVLDNAASTDQITPLLPGSRHSTVLITSRNRLRGLVARHGAHPVHLGVLTASEARGMLTTTVGAAGDARAVAELSALCGGFPLALGVIAGRVAANPRLPLQDVVAELRAFGLAALDCDDPTASLPTALSWSLRHLADRHRTTFALLSIAPGPDTGLAAATALTGLPERETRAVLDALADASLIEHAPGGRYGMHDLVRVYATSIDLPAEVREGALRRVLDFYTRTALAAERILRPHRDPSPVDLPSAGVRPLPLPDTSAALAWFDVEHAGLIAAQHTAAAQRWHAVVWQLAWALDSFHYRRGHPRDQLTVWRAATDAATHLSDPVTSAIAHQRLGVAYAESGHHEVGLEHLHHALALAEHAPVHQARTHHMLARAWEQHGDDLRALDHARRGLDLFRGLGQRAWEAEALNSVGWYAARLGDYDTAREHCQAALALQRHHHPTGEASTFDSLGYIEHHSGHHQQAVRHYRRALVLRRALGNTYQAANTLEALGHPYAALGDTAQAHTVWREALRLYREQGRLDDAARVRRNLEPAASGDGYG